jgi:hypothetical protein
MHSFCAILARCASVLIHALCLSFAASYAIKNNINIHNKGKAVRKSKKVRTYQAPPALRAVDRIDVDIGVDKILLKFLDAGLKKHGRQVV